ncbi:hypothetical protein GGS20DRAFT_593487 [Poronia punctata]|nr:hypothetical protein GGS20DRAFT_593487 [Poronia punctata]
MEVMNIDGPEQQEDYSHTMSSSDTHYSECPSGSEDNDSYSDESGDEGPHTSAVVGRSIAAVFNDNSLIPDTDLDEEDDDDTSATEMSSVYEELDFPRDPSQFFERVLNVEEQDDDSSHADSSYLPSDDESEEDGEDGAEGDDVAEGESPELEITGNGPVRVEIPDTLPATPVDQAQGSGIQTVFADLQKKPFPGGVSALNLYERARWRVMELEEMKRAVEREIAEAEELRDCFFNDLDAGRAEFAGQREKVGISMGLWDEYMAFCESMEPEPGSVTGWSICCDQDHKNSYVEYDPSFTLYKEHSDGAYKQQNFRCEAIVEQNIVEFWPVPYPSFDIEEASTWGELYPRLYELAVVAVRNGSKAAMDLLIALPDQHASFKGGWLFEYNTADPKKSKYNDYHETDDGTIWTNDPVQSRRWHFSSAHKVEVPVDAATKRARLELALQPEYVTHSDLVPGPGLPPYDAVLVLGGNVHASGTPDLAVHDAAAGLDAREGGLLDPPLALCVGVDVGNRRGIPSPPAGKTEGS